MVIPVAHDYICPWCWIALFQTKELHREFGVTFDWKGYELMPEELPWGESAPVPQVETNRPKTPGRMTLAYYASGVVPPTGERPKRMRSHNALEATEFVKAAGGDVDAFIESMYRGYWEHGREINALDVIKELADGNVSNPDQLVEAVIAKEFDDKIVKFDDDAYAAGVYNVPTYWIDGERYAEQPTAVLADAIRSLA